jgi:hypothetical protein
MPIIGIRVPFHLKDQVEKVAQQSNKTVSEFLRELIESNLKPMETEDWEVIAWNLFKMSPDQISYALSHSRSPEEFFASVGHKAPHLELRVSRSQDEATVSIIYDGTVIADTYSRELPKLEAIGIVIKNIDYKLQAIQLKKMEEAHANIQQAFTLKGDGGSEVQTGSDPEGNGN